LLGSDGTQSTLRVCDLHHVPPINGNTDASVCESCAPRPVCSSACFVSSLSIMFMDCAPTTGARLCAAARRHEVHMSNGTRRRRRHALVNAWCMSWPRVDGPPTFGCKWTHVVENGRTSAPRHAHAQGRTDVVRTHQTHPHTCTYAGVRGNVHANDVHTRAPCTTASMMRLSFGKSVAYLTRRRRRRSPPHGRAGPSWWP
jgi:hypothetical protein